MKPFLIVFNERVSDFKDVQIVEFRKMFADYDRAQEWALLTAQTSNLYRHLILNIRVQQITDTITIHYHGE